MNRKNTFLYSTKLGYAFCGFILVLLLLLSACDTSPPKTTDSTSADSVCLDPAGVKNTDKDYRGNNYTGPYGYCLYNLDELPAATELYKFDARFNGSEAERNTAFIGTSNINLATGDMGDRIVLYAQGGPVGKVSNFSFFDFITDQTFDNDTESWSFLTVNQYQNLDPFVYMKRSSEIDMTEAVRNSAWSAAALYKVAKHFKEQGKKVYILSHSFGSFVTPKMMADYKYEDYIDKVLVLAGRLIMPEGVYAKFANKFPVGFIDRDNDGLFNEIDEAVSVEATFPLAEFEKLLNKIKTGNATQEEIQDFPIIMSETDLMYAIDNYSAAQIYNTLLSSPKLQASLGQYNFIKFYTDFDVPLKKAYFVSAKKDAAVGYYSNEEKNFASNTTLVGGFHESEGEHDVDEPADITYYFDFFNH